MSWRRTLIWPDSLLRCDEDFTYYPHSTWQKTLKTRVMELTIEDLKRKNEWLSKENKRMRNDILSMNGTIEAYQKERKETLETLVYCGHNYGGTAYKECHARIRILNMHEAELKSALENDLMPASIYRELLDLVERAQDIMDFEECELNRIFYLIKEYSTYQRAEEIKSPFGK